MEDGYENDHEDDEGGFMGRTKGILEDFFYCILILGIVVLEMFGKVLDLVFLGIDFLRSISGKRDVEKMEKGEKEVVNRDGKL